MKKDFDKWNILKKKVDAGFVDFYVQTREIWWCSIGLNVGSEQNGHGENFERPVLIVKKYNSHSFLCLPLTTKEKIGSYFYRISITSSFVILSQARALDKKRLTRLVGRVPRQEFHDIVRNYKRLI